MVVNLWSGPAGTAMAVAAILALAVSAQPMPPPPTAALPTQAPPPPGSGFMGSGYQVDFGSDGSAFDEGSGSTWQPMPTAGSDTSNMDWSWFYGTEGPPNAGGADNDQGGRVELVFPGHDGSIEAIARRVYEFDASQGFRLLAEYNWNSRIYPGNCYHAYCVHIVFESDYGAMSPFDAFVLHRYESATGPVAVGYDSEWSGGGPMPLILGRLSDETRSRLQEGDWTNGVFNWNEDRRTMWTIHPKAHLDDRNANSSGPREIDLTLSLKQLYTLLPGYRESAAANATDGPFYSADPTDQLIIRVSAAIPSPFASASAMLPIVVKHTGSQLVDINLTSTMLFQDGVSGGNEIQLTFKLSRRKFGGIMPWFPAKLSDHCVWTTQQNQLPDAVERCLDALPVMIKDLLSWRNDRSWLNVTAAAETCFSAIASGEWTNGTATEQVRYFDGIEWVSKPSPPLDVDARLDILRRTDAVLRNRAETQCPLSGTQLKADAQVVVLKHTPARARITSVSPNFTFYLQFGFNGTDGKWTTTTTEVFSGSTPTWEIQSSLANAFPDLARRGSDGYVDVTRYDNRDAIEAIKSENEWRMREYERARRWGNSGDSSSDGRSVGFEDGNTDDSSSSSSSSSWSDEDAGGMEPQPPTLRPLPPLNFTTEIVWSSITFAPRVLTELSAEATDVSYETRNQSLVMQVAPLDVNKFQYVPPPPSVDLSWPVVPEWVKNLRHYLPVFAANDSCGKCMSAYEACLYDLDCAYGVTYNLRWSLSQFNLGWRAKLVNQTHGQERFRYQLDVSDVLHDARKFFPPNGYAKWMDLVSCWVKQRCNLDDDRSIFYPSLNRWIPAKPTVFANVGTEIRIVGDINTRFDLSYNGISSSYAMTGDETVDSFAKFLHDNVLMSEPAALDDVEIAIDKVNDGVRISLRWAARDMSRLYIKRLQSWRSSVTTKPVSLVIAADRTNVIEGGPWEALQWNRLNRWLDIFYNVPSSSFPRTDYPSGTGWNSETDDSSSLSWIRPNLTSRERPIYTSPSSVCLKCANLLQMCVSDMKCASAIRNWLPTVLPANGWSLDIHERARWNDSVLNSAESTTEPLFSECRERVLALVSCLARNGCPVGTSKTQSEPNWWWAATVVPTTIRFKAKRVVTLVNRTTFRLSFRDLPEREVDQYAYGMWQYFDVAQTWRGENIQFSRLLVEATNKTEFTFTGSYQALQDLKITNVSAPSSVGDVVYTASFESSSSTGINWDYLLGWFGLRDAERQCEECVPKLKACYDDSECWRSAQESVVPILEQRADRVLSWTSRYDEGIGQTVYKVELGSALLDLIAGVSPSVVPAFTTPTSWTLFTDIFMCFASSRCDVETMDSAMEPPATAHVPSYLQIVPASAQLLLYLNSQIRIDFNGQSIDYSEMASGSPEALTATLRTAVSGSNISFVVELTSSDLNAQWFDYKITFDNPYMGRLPQFTVVSPGKVTTTNEPFATLTPWNVLVQSVGQFPEWDKISKSFSSPPQPPSTLPDMTIFECESAVAMRSACHASYECMSLLTMALPLMTNYIHTVYANYISAPEQPVTVDLGWAIESQLSSGYTKETTSMFLDMLRESAFCATQSSETSSPRPIFEDTNMLFYLPPGSEVSISYITESVWLDQDDPSVDRIASLEQFVYDSIVQPSGQNVSVMHKYRISSYTGTLEVHEFTFPRFYWSQYPLITITNPATRTVISTGGAWFWRLWFRSPTSRGLDDAAVPWFTWLSMN